MRAKPGQNLKTIFAGQFEVEQEKIRKGELSAVGKFAFSIEIRHGFLAIGHDVQRGLNTSLLEGTAEHGHVVRTILSEQNYWLTTHGTIVNGPMLRTVRT